MSTLFKDIPLDQVTAMGCQLLSLVVAVVFYHIFHIKSYASVTRQAISTTIGVVITLLCYKAEAIHLYVLCLLGYAILLYAPVGKKGWISFAVGFGHVLLVHLDSYFNYYMEFRVEISNSLMVLAAKVSLTAFSADDHYKTKTKLTPNQLKFKLMAIPTFFEYFSYCFCFAGILFGPIYHFAEYLRFIRGDQYKEKWPLGRATRMLLVSLICLLLHFLLSERYGAEYNLTPAVLGSSVPTRHIIMWLTMLLARLKYYFSWISSEAICHLSGLGYESSQNGECESTMPTVRILGVEFATSLKMFSDNWNIFTARFLHFCIYERVSKYKVPAVFICSAVWHGFYPGYYIMFTPLAVGVILGRKIRRILRPRFQNSKFSQRVYDFITWTATTTLIAFNSCAFELKDWNLIYKFQRSMYFWPHILLLVGMLVVPNLKTEINHQQLSNGKAHQA